MSHSECAFSDGKHSLGFTISVNLININIPSLRRGNWSEEWLFIFPTVYIRGIRDKGIENGRSNVKNTVLFCKDIVCISFDCHHSALLTQLRRKEKKGKKEFSENISEVPLCPVTSQLSFFLWWRCLEAHLTLGRAYGVSFMTYWFMWKEFLWAWSNPRPGALIHGLEQSLAISILICPCFPSVCCCNQLWMFWPCAKVSGGQWFRWSYSSW